jgi:TRAP-type transport system periplasmic protein
MRRLKKIALAAVLALAVPGFASADEVTKLKFVTLSPADGPLNTRVLHPWAERVNAAGKGIIEIDVRDGYSVANYDNVYERVLVDVAQIAFTVTGSIAGKFVLSNVVALPMLFERPDEASVAFWRLYKSGALDSEYTDIVPLYIVTLANSSFHLTRAPNAPDDIRGFKIVASSKTTSSIVSALGATPISFQQSDIYTALQRKAVDGTYAAWTAFPPFKLGEITSYHIEARLGGAPAMVFMAKKTFAALPPAARKILEENSGEAQSRRFGEYWMNLDDEVRKQFQNAPGHTIVNLTPEQTRAWQAKLQPVVDQWSKDVNGGAETLAAYRKLLAEVKAGR